MRIELRGARGGGTEGHGKGESGEAVCVSVAGTAEMRDHQQPNTQKGNRTIKYINQNTRNTPRN